jgi:DmsE family decaheme c-type cytochrome
MRVTPRFDLVRMLGILGAALLLLADAPAALAQPAPGKASPEETCKQCHADYFSGYARSKHGTKADLRAPANNGGCLACHGDAALEHAAKGGGRGVGGVLGFNDRKVPAETKNEVCLTCHQGGKRIHWDRSTHAASEVACVSCHEVHAAHDKVRDRMTQTEVCFTCHKEQRAQMRRPSRHPIDEGKVVCSDCHNPHGTAGPKLLVRDSVNDTCYTCHMEKRGPFVRSHEPVQEDCTICHNPHGTTTPALLKVRPPFLCQSCHEPTSHHSQVPDDTPVGGANPVLGQAVIMARGCLNCHTNIHGSNNAADGAGRGFRR